MTRDPRADELLLAVLSFCVSVEECADRAFLCHDAHGLGDRIRAYLDESQGEPEYVWRVVGSDQDGDWVHHPPSYDDEPEVTAIRYRENYGGTVERAQIGPWEKV